jgi:tetratricopeptide (TPR) repeat protein
MFPALRDSAMARAFALRERLPERERDLVMATWYSSPQVSDRPRAIAAYERMLVNGDTAAAANNLALQLRDRREFDRAEALFRIATRGSTNILALNNLRGTLEMQGKWAAADSVLAEMQRLQPGSARVAVMAASARYQRGDMARVRTLLDSLLRNPDPQDPRPALGLASDVALREGRLRDETAALEKLWRLDSALGRPVDPIARLFSDLAQHVDHTGLPFEAELRAFEAAIARDPLMGRPVSDAVFYAAARLLARAGRPELARRVFEENDRAITDTTLRRRLTISRSLTVGQILAAEGKLTDAVRELRRADSLPDGPAGFSPAALPIRLFEVFAKAGEADSALVQFEAYLATPLGSRPRSGPDFSLSALTVEAAARLYESRGDTTNALKWYRDLAQRWERADPELQPRVAEIKRRIEALAPVERSQR